MLDAGAVADLELDQAVGLVGDAVGPVVGLDDGHGGTIFDHDQHPRIGCERPVAEVAEFQVQRLFGFRPGRDAQEDPVVHEGAVERHGGVGGIVTLARQHRRRLRPRIVAVGDRAVDEALALDIREGAAVDEQDAGRSGDGEPRPQALGALHQLRRKRVETLGQLRHQRLEVGVFPLLDAAVGQAAGLERSEPLFAQALDRRPRPNAAGGP